MWWERNNFTFRFFFIIHLCNDLCCHRIISPHLCWVLCVIWNIVHSMQYHSVSFIGISDGQIWSDRSEIGWFWADRWQIGIGKIQTSPDSTNRFIVSTKFKPKCYENDLGTSQNRSTSGLRVLLVTKHSLKSTYIGPLG